MRRCSTPQQQEAPGSASVNGEREVEAGSRLAGGKSTAAATAAATATNDPN